MSALCSANTSPTTSCSSSPARHLCSLLTDQADADAIFKQLVGAPSAAARGAAFDLLVGDLSCASDPASLSACRALCPMSHAAESLTPSPPAFRLPSLQELMAALEACGYDFDRQVGRASGGPSPCEPDSGGGALPSELQIYTVKLLLRLAGYSVDRHLAGQQQGHTGSQAQELLLWIQACCSLRTDAAAPALGDVIDAALPRFLEAFGETEWAEQGAASLPGLAARLVRRAPCSQACLDMLRLLPYTPRGQALRLNVGGSLLASLIPGYAAAVPATPSLTASSLVCQQPW